MFENISSKGLSHNDDSGFDFAREMLAGDVTAGINFDRLQCHPEHGYIIFEYLLCEEKQSVTPWSSHPNRYWEKNKSKFIALFKASKVMNATLYLVNYAKKGTRHENEILVIEVLAIDFFDGITDSKTWKTTRSEFQSWFRNLNAECLKYMGDLPRYYIDFEGDPLDMQKKGAHYDKYSNKWYYTDPLDQHKFVK